MFSQRNTVYHYLGSGCLGGICYLLFVTGRRAKDEEVHLVLIDRMFVRMQPCIDMRCSDRNRCYHLCGLDSTLNSGMGFEVITYPLTALLVLRVRAGDGAHPLPRAQPEKPHVRRAVVHPARQSAGAGARQSASAAGSSGAARRFGMASAAAGTGPVAQGVSDYKTTRYLRVYSPAIRRCSPSSPCCSAWWRRITGT